MPLPFLFIFQGSDFFMLVYLINEGTKPFKDKCAGRQIVIPPGKAAKVPEYVAYHLIGDPRVINGENDLAAEAEKKRVYLRYAAFTPEDRETKIPKLRIEPVEEEEIPIVDLKAKEKIEMEPEEPEFPQLKEELKKNDRSL